MDIKKFIILYSFILLILINNQLIIAESSKKNMIFVGGTGEGNYTSIQNAINNSEKGDVIYVYKGIYNENIRLYKKLTLIGENKNSTVLTNNGKSDIIYISTNNCILKGFSIINNSNSSFSAINIESNYNIISDNIIANNKGWGVYLYYSLGNNISNNNFINDSINIVGDKNSWISQNIKNNKVNKKPLYYFKNISNLYFYNESGQIILANCSNIKISNLSIDYADQAIVIGFSRNCTIENNNLFYNQFGIRLNYAIGNKIFKNNLRKNNYGLYITHSDKNMIFDNNISYNNLFGCWICCYSNNNTIYKNNFSFNDVNAYDLFNNKWYITNIGNYWSDYEGLDENQDGIGEKPYYGILPDGRNIDQYPIVRINKLSDNNRIIGFDFSLFCIILLFLFIVRKFLLC
jgi:parallel beta-helix repeat protein